jgi:hypothetical protein
MYCGITPKLNSRNKKLERERLIIYKLLFNNKKTQAHTEREREDEDEDEDEDEAYLIKESVSLNKEHSSST